MGNVILPYWGSQVLADEADRITDGVAGIHIYLNTGKRSSMQPKTGDNVDLVQISDLSENFLDSQINSGVGQEPRIQENELNGNAVLEFLAAEGHSLVIGDNTNHKLFHNGSPFVLYSILRLNSTPTSSLFQIITRTGGDVNGFFLVINATTRTVLTAAYSQGEGNLFQLTSTTGLALNTWYKIRLIYRGFNHPTLNDAELYINDNLEASVGTSNNRSNTGNSQFALEILGAGTLRDTDHSMLLTADNTGKTDTQVDDDHTLINEVISNIQGL